MTLQPGQDVADIQYGAYVCCQGQAACCGSAEAMQVPGISITSAASRALLQLHLSQSGVRLGCTDAQPPCYPALHSCQQVQHLEAPIV